MDYKNILPMILYRLRITTGKLLIINNHEENGTTYRIVYSGPKQFFHFEAKVKT